MLSRVYSIYDVKTKVYLPPVYCQNDDDAMRFMTMRLEGFPLMAKFPQDYRLYYIGTFNDANGVLERSDKPEFVCEIIDLLINEDRKNE